MSKKEGKTPGKKEAALTVGEQQLAGDFLIAPSTTPTLDASNWPLLLRNYDRLNVRPPPRAAATRVLAPPAAAARLGCARLGVQAPAPAPLLRASGADSVPRRFARATTRPSPRATRR